MAIPARSKQSPRQAVNPRSRKGVMYMNFTYEAFVQTGILICAIIKLVIDVYNKKR